MMHSALLTSMLPKHIHIDHWPRRIDQYNNSFHILGLQCISFEIRIVLIAL